MKYTTLQLIFRHWYAGVTLFESAAVEELERRGWKKPFRVAVLIAILPFILPERIIVELDMGDPWEEADWPTIWRSFTFSAWMVSPLVFLVCGVFAVAKMLDGHPPNWWPTIISGGIFALTSLDYLYTVWRWKRKRRHEA